jgi:hypothetical protein
MGINGWQKGQLALFNLADNIGTPLAEARFEAALAHLLELEASEKPPCP